MDRLPVPEYSAALSSACAHDVLATIAALSCGRVVLLSDELVLHRLHEGNVTLRPRAAGLTRLAPDPQALERGAENYAGLARFLRYAASSCHQSAHETFCDYIRQVECYSHVCGERARLYRMCGHRWMALRTLSGMLAKGNYAPRSLGARAFVRDALLVAFWPIRLRGALGEMPSPAVEISRSDKTAINQ